MENREIIDLLSDSESGTETTKNDVIKIKVYTLSIDGAPAAMQRPAFMAWVKNQHLFRRVVNKTSPKVQIFRQVVINMLWRQYSVKAMDLPLFAKEGVVVNMTFCRRLPKTAFFGGRRTEGDLRNTDDTADLCTPDIDNMAKFVLDALTGVVYADDRQVSKSIQHKIWDVSPPYEGRTLISFKAITVEDLQGAHMTS